MPEEACPSGQAAAGPEVPAAQSEVMGWSVGLVLPTMGLAVHPLLRPLDGQDHC